MIRELTLETLEHLDLGKGSAAFRSSLKRVAVDCLDRPLERKPRSVTMEIAVVPAPDEKGNCDRVKVQIHVTSKVPAMRTQVYDLGLRANGSLAFSEDSPSRFSQTTLLDDMDAGDEE